MAAQGGCCQICTRELRVESGPRRRSADAAVVDRCHRTGVVRGLLCTRCDVGIGLFEDDPYRLVNAARYVERYRKLRHEPEASAVVQPEPRTGDELLDDLRRNPEVYVAFSPGVKTEVDAMVRKAFSLGPDDPLPPPVPIAPAVPVMRSRAPHVLRTSWGEDVDLNDPRVVDRMQSDPEFMAEIDRYIAKQIGRAPGESAFPAEDPAAQRRPKKPKRPKRGAMPDEVEFHRRMATVLDERDSKVGQRSRTKSD